jgi:hypothetical protein
MIAVLTDTVFLYVFSTVLRQVGLAMLGRLVSNWTTCSRFPSSAGGSAIEWPLQKTSNTELDKH